MGGGGGGTAERPYGLDTPTELRCTSGPGMHHELGVRKGSAAGHELEEYGQMHAGIHPSAQLAEGRRFGLCLSSLIWGGGGVSLEAVLRHASGI